MIRIQIGKKTYKGAYRWSNITLAKFCELAALPMPDGYEAYILADGKFTVENIEQYIEAVSKITDKQLNEDFPAYYRKVIGVLTNIPDSVILDKEKAGDMYEYYFKPFVVSLIYHIPMIHFMGQLKQYEPPEIDRIVLGWNIFRLPETVNIMEQDIPLAREPVITYIEASDIFKGLKITKDDVKRLALFLAIYCRKRGEKYDEQKALQRQDLFMKAPMSVVWSVFFYTLRRIPDCGQSIQLFGRLPKPIREVVDRVRAYRDLVTEV